jgi:hypothetical protein
MMQDMKNSKKLNNKLEPRFLGIYLATLYFGYRISKE